MTSRVRAVLDHLERDGATTRVRVNGARQHPDVDGLVLAAFRQATSREDDPQLHTHVMISTKVRTAYGRWLALDARYLKRKRRALGGLYQSVLRAELTHRFGVAWEPIVNGQAEIAGMPRELLDAFSKRTAQVDALLAAKVTEFRGREGRDPPGGSEPRSPAKQPRPHASPRPTPRPATSKTTGATKRATSDGHRINAAMRTAARGVPSKDSIAVAEVLEQLSASGSSWTRADVLQAICDMAPPMSQLSGRDWANAVERAADRVIDRRRRRHGRQPHRVAPQRTRHRDPERRVRPPARAARLRRHRPRPSSRHRGHRDRRRHRGNESSQPLRRRHSGRQQNRLLVVADDTDRAVARDVLERVLTNDRADVPAVVQRRSLARQVPRLRAEDAVEVARRALDEVRHGAEPFLAVVRAAEAGVCSAEQALRKQLAARDEAPRWRRRGMASGIERASEALAGARSRLETAEHAASPHRARIDAAERAVHDAEREASRARLAERLDRLTLEPPARVADRGLEIDPPGFGR